MPHSDVLDMQENNQLHSLTGREWIWAHQFIKDSIFSINEKEHLGLPSVFFFSTGILIISQYLITTMNLWDQTSAPCTFPTSGAARAATTASSPRSASLRTGHGHSTSASSSQTGNQNLSLSPTPGWSLWPEGWTHSPATLTSRSSLWTWWASLAAWRGRITGSAAGSHSSSQEVGLEEQHTPRVLSVKLYQPSLSPLGSIWLPVCVRDSWNTTWVSLRDG